MNRPTILLNPGPVTLSDRVRRALMHEDVCHREPDFAQLMLDIKRRLAHVYPQVDDEFDAIALTGSGTCAVEAMIASFAPRETKTLVLANGVYGDRIIEMLKAHHRPMVQAQSAWIDAINFERAEQLLADDETITHVVAVHNETTTGRLNDVEALLALAARHKRQLMLDAVSSFGAEAIDFTHPNLLAAASTGNKCLHGIVGIAFVMARKAVLASATSQSDSLYLDLFAYHKAQQKGFSPFTQATHACFALAEALAELEESGGWRARQTRYQTLSAAIRDALDELGVQLYLPDEAYSSMISSFHLPKGWTYERLHDELRAAGFVIYAGQGNLSKSMFRICNMGDIQDEDLDRLLSVLRRLLG